jgi:hypothetical protein
LKHLPYVQVVVGLRCEFNFVNEFARGVADMSLADQKVPNQAAREEWSRNVAEPRSNVEDWRPEAVYSGWLGWPAQQASDAQVFVDVRPVDAFAFAEEFEIPALIGRSVQKSREPSQRDRDLAAVGEQDS